MSIFEKQTCRKLNYLENINFEESDKSELDNSMENVKSKDNYKNNNNKNITKENLEINTNIDENNNKLNSTIHKYETLDKLNCLNNSLALTDNINKDIAINSKENTHICNKNKNIKEILLGQKRELNIKKCFANMLKKNSINKNKSNRVNINDSYNTTHKQCDFKVIDNLLSTKCGINFINYNKYNINFITNKSSDLNNNN